MARRTRHVKYFPRKQSPLPLVLVRWLDAYTIDETYDASDCKNGTPAAPTVTVGFLVADNKEGVTVTTDVQYPLPGDDDKTLTFRGKHFVPRGMVQEIIFLRR